MWLPSNKAHEFGPSNIHLLKAPNGLLKEMPEVITCIFVYSYSYFQSSLKLAAPECTSSVLYKQGIVTRCN